jgi:hypothetical protein
MQRTQHGLYASIGMDGDGGDIVVPLEGLCDASHALWGDVVPSEVQKANAGGRVCE